MAFQTNDDLQRAKDALTIQQLWEFAGLPPAIEGRDGKYLSPFRDERTPSFSISKEGKVWCDFGGGPGAKGGVWEFAERIWPNLDRGGIAKKLIEASGIDPTPRPLAPPSAPGVATVDPKVARAAADLDRKRRLREAEERVYEQRQKQLERPEIHHAPTWPTFVRERWDEGVRALRGMPKKIEELAAARGWPVAWVWELVESDLLSYVWERGFDGGEKWAKRQKAFRVDQPTFPNMRAAALEPIGYHQRFFMPAKDGAPAAKKWMFVPSVPRFSPRSNFERELVAFGAKHGSVPPSPSAIVPPLPFVLGDLDAPRLIVLLEGQWDAITFFGACGWFSDTTPPIGVAVFGIRGAQGVDPFLAHYWNYLDRIKPLCWVIADNDAAGSTWRDAPAAEVGKIRPPSFADRLKAAGCREVLISWLTRGTWGKDFNDYYRARAAAGFAPGPEQMFKWMRRVGVMDSAGRFA